MTARRAELLLSIAVIAAASAAACRPPSRGEAAGCGADRDCKLDRICEQGRCVWPERNVPVAASVHPSADALSRATGEDVGDPADAAPAVLEAGFPSMFRGDPAHRGRTSALLPSRAPAILWRYRTGGPVTSSPLVLPDGTIAVGSHDGSLHVVDPLGQRRFRFPTGDLIFSSPATDGRDRVYFGSGDDHLYGVDLARGVQVFRTRLGNCAQTRGVGPEQTRCDVDGGPTVGPDGTIYAGGAGVFAVSPGGSLRWRFETRERIATAPLLLPDGTIVAGGLDDTLYALHPDGSKRWDFRAGGDIESTPALTEDGLIVFGCDDDKVYALDTSGQLQWAFTTGGDVRASPAIGRDGSVLIGSFDGLFYAIGAGGVLGWSFRTGDRIASSALVDGRGAILFGSQDDRLYALEASGHLRWSVELDGDLDSSPALGPDGTIFIGSDDHHLYALRSPD